MTKLLLMRMLPFVLLASLGADAPRSLTPEEQSISRNIEFLAADRLEGRMTGQPGEREATLHVAREFARMDLEPLGDVQADGSRSYFQDFEFSSGVKLDAGNTAQLTHKEASTELALEQDWRPMGFSASGELKGAVVFAGYGIQAPAEGDRPAMNSYSQMDPRLLQGKWAVVFRYLPENMEAKEKMRLNRYAQLEYKAAVARDLGAKGILIVSGPTSHAKHQLVPLRIAGGGVPKFIALTLTDAAAQKVLAPSGFELGDLQKRLDQGEWLRPFEIPQIQFSARAALHVERAKGRNVLGRLAVAGAGTKRVIVGAHVDHLGHGESGASLASGDQEGGIHHGADDNASGVSAMLEIARQITERTRKGDTSLKRSVVFAAWSGEELGLLGSQAFIEHEPKCEGEAIYPCVSAYFNLDMVGRLRDKLNLQGVGSSPDWKPAIELRGGGFEPKLELLEDPYLPSDSSSFYIAGVPVLDAFTGAHADYHTPGDTSDKINVGGVVKVATLVAALAWDQAARSDAPSYRRVERSDGGKRSGFRASLGVMPDYSAEGVVGLRIMGTKAGSPAEKAGLLAGDILTELAGKRIETIYDYMFALNIVKIGEPNLLKYRRGDKNLSVEVIPESRE